MPRSPTVSAPSGHPVSAKLDQSGTQSPCSAWPVLQSPRDIGGIDRAAGVASAAARAAARSGAPGVRTAELAEIVRRVVTHHGGRPAFEGYAPADAASPFPGAACVCVNEQAVHAPPGCRELHPGDIVTVDVGVELDCWFGDIAESFVVPGGPTANRPLLRACRATVAAAVRACGPGVRWSKVCRTVRASAARNGLTVLSEFTGHGIGRRLHEAPRAGYAVRPGQPGDFLLLPGMVLTIEPVLVAPPGRLRLGADGWTVRTADESPACHVERMVHITRNGASVLGRRI